MDDRAGQYHYTAVPRHRGVHRRGRGRAWHTARVLITLAWCVSALYTLARS